MAESMAFIKFILKRRRTSMELFNKKFFGSLFMFTALICLCTVKVEGMENHEPINPFAPLQELCKHCVEGSSIRKAFNDTFGLICTMVVHDHNPSKSIHWLENPAIGEAIKGFYHQLNEQVTYRHDAAEQQHIEDQMECFRRDFEDQMKGFHSQNMMQYRKDPYQGLYYFELFQILKNDVACLNKKIAVLISLLNEELASSVTASGMNAGGTNVASTSAAGAGAAGNGQRPTYLDDVQLLQSTVESIVTWLPWEEWKESWKQSWRDIQALWENMHALWRKAANSCEIL